MTVTYVNVNDQLTNIAQIARGAPMSTLRRAYVRALREFCQQTLYVRDNVAGLTVQGTQDYTLGDDPLLDIVAIQAMSVTKTLTSGDTQTLVVVASDSGLWDPNLSQDIPRRYCYVPQAQFSVNPVPDAAYDLTITIVVQPKETATQIPSAPLVKYSNEIEADALAYLHSIPGQPWSSPTAAALRQREFQAGIANGKAEVQRAFNTGSVRARPRLFGFGGRAR